MNKQKITSIVLCAAVMVVVSSDADAQRVQFSQPAVTNTAQLGSGTRMPAPPLTPTNNGLAPVGPPPAGTVPGGTGLQAPAFNPYQPQAAATAPALQGAPPPPGVTYGAPAATGVPAQPYYGQPAYGQPAYGQPAPGYPGYPAQPPSQFPGGFNWFGSPAGTPAGPGPYLKAVRDLRVRYTFIPGDPGSSGNELQINDLETAVTFSFPNFLHSGEPLNVSPGFVFHWWAGPSTTTSDLPAQAYSAYLEFDWITNQKQRFGGEVDFTAGIYSDFNKINSRSLRFTGTGLGWYRITNNLTVKGGIQYLDRVDIKLLPAGGLFWTPNDDVRWEIYFPRPKLSQRLTTLGNTDLWWYIAAEYGGGSWTVERALGPLAGSSDQVDINDIRVYGGFEWFSRMTTVKGFVELGWVTERKLVYRNDSAANISLKDSLMLRGGLAF